MKSAAVQSAALSGTWCCTHQSDAACSCLLRSVKIVGAGVIVLLVDTSSRQGFLAKKVVIARCFLLPDIELNVLE
ncbi:hypothetical protein PR003_g9711 [Phytophthora rubi]|uniref:Uncharacterized protein n=1 Tax=Phytophthora rubi TaxID=129364 RepID=A0A6A4FDH2_9STRA|nr:hypothetical protein PR002_g7582 [Phytophthora rubi]KAE9341978.1 hypothetical protein PR003_g9711 [Phytophthora rubi]